MRFQHRDYDNGRYLDEPNFRSNFIHQSTYSTVKSNLVQAQGNTSLKYIESQSRLLLIYLRLPNSPRQAKRAEDHRPQAKRQRGRQENFCIHPPTQLITEGALPSGFWILRPQEVAQQEIQELRFNHAKDFEPATTGSRYSSQFEPAHRLLHVPTPSGARIHLLPNLKDRP